MKKKIIQVISIVVLCALGLLLIWNLTDCATLCVADQKVEQTFADSWKMRMLLGVEKYEFTTYGCPFSADYSVTMGGLTYCIATDGCNSVYIPELNMYYLISQDNISALHSIMAAYK